MAAGLAACAATSPDRRGESASAGGVEEEVQLVVETSEGAMLWVVYPGKAPITAGNFLRLVDAKAYNDASFYRTVRPDNDRNPATINVIQGGLSRPDVADGKSSPFPPIAHETTDQTGLRHIDGALSMARLEPGTAQAEFFVSIGENPVLDTGGARNPDKQGFAVFGQVLEGMDVVRKIHASSANAATTEGYVQGQMLDEPVRIISITRQSPNPDRSN
ncbi:peptidylprolyl isomerase [Lysobacteraceae bacterium NML08-0793]|nr:peptidylprolyl isomerase [Xanthomonadaceae bacterium NML08-0793]